MEEKGEINRCVSVQTETFSVPFFPILIFN